jgi:hypothetical protein
MFCAWRCRPLVPSWGTVLATQAPYNASQHPLSSGPIVLPVPQEFKTTQTIAGIADPLIYNLVDQAPATTVTMMAGVVAAVMGEGAPAAPDAGPTAAQATEGDPQKTRSRYLPGDRLKFNTKKGAREAAKRAGGGNEPVHDPYDEYGPHYHPGDGQGGRLKDNHDHYYYPKSRGPKGAR